jgi:acetate kinase
LGFLGIEIEEKRNMSGAPLISIDKGQVSVRVIHTDEELMIAKTVSKLLNLILK